MLSRAFSLFVTERYVKVSLKAERGSHHMLNVAVEYRLVRPEFLGGAHLRK
jgi:hypothetical protein